MEPNPAFYDRMARVPIDYVYAKMLRDKVKGEIHRKYYEITKP